MVGQMEVMLILLGIVGVLALIAERTGFPFPIMMVLGGVVIALVPQLPSVSMDPDLVLVVFLPPLIYSAAFFFPWDEFRTNLRPILVMAIGLVLTTMVCVALVADWLIPGLTLAAAFVLGAVVSPPDAVAANAVLAPLRVPQRLRTVLEGESLVNDASALVAYSFAISAVVTGSFSLGLAAVDFVWVSVGGVAWGLATGWVVSRLHERIKEPGTGMTLEILAPYMAYAPADHFGVSGVLAAVAAGLYVGSRATQVLDSRARLQGEAIWGFINYFLNGVIFILIGLEFPVIMKELAAYPLWTLVLYGVTVSVVVVVVRFAWLLSLPALSHRFLPKLRMAGPPVPRRALIVAGWAGMRGAVSLAAALAIPELTEAGAEFPGRELIIFLTYCVIVATLVLPGLTLPWLVRRLGIEESASGFSLEMSARVSMLHEVVEVLKAEAIAEAVNLRSGSVRVVREYFETRYEHLRVWGGESDPDDRDLAGELRLFQAMLALCRRRLEEMRNDGLIDEGIRRDLARELDAEEMRIERTLRRR